MLSSAHSRTGQSDVSVLAPRGSQGSRNSTLRPKGVGVGALGPTGGPGSWALSPVDGAGVGPMAAMGAGVGGNRGGYRGPVNWAVSHLDIAAGAGVDALGPTRRKLGSFSRRANSRTRKWGEHRFRMDHDAQSGLGQPASACIMSSLACSTCSTVREPLLSESTHV